MLALLSACVSCELSCLDAFANIEVPDTLLLLADGGDQDVELGVQVDEDLRHLALTLYHNVRVWIIRLLQVC